jgi:hypothetical protein
MRPLYGAEETEPGADLPLYALSEVVIVAKSILSGLSYFLPFTLLSVKRRIST